MYSECRPKFVLAASVIVALLTHPILADAIVMTRAMQASTIAEIFIESGNVRVELEIGSADLPAFSNLLPDAADAQLVPGLRRPSQQQLETFFREGLVIRIAKGEPMKGEVKQLAVRKRIVRDEITGEPLPDQPSEAERIVFASLNYPLPTPGPKVLAIRPPTKQGIRSTSADIGFVAYHNGLPINDFRYLSQEATMNLNWDDPWYSHFEHPNLQRQYAAPMAGYLYVEPFEVRKEIIARPKDLAKFIDLQLDFGDVIPVNRQEALKQRIGEFLSEKNPVLIDGQRATGKLDRIHFIRRSLRRTGIIDPPEPLDLTSATLGVIFVYPIDGLPQEVTMNWELFNERIQEVPAATSDEAGPLPANLTPDDSILRWQNFLKHPTIPTLVRIAQPPMPSVASVPVVSLLCCIVFFVLAKRVIQNYSQASGNSARTAMLCLTTIVFGFAALPYARFTIAIPFSDPLLLTDEDADETLTGLLHNVYRAFDRRDPSLIYDQLSRSISGELLEQVYLDTRKSIEIENQGGLKINVAEVDVFELQSKGKDRSGLTFRCRWHVSGAVGHWGHIHQRTNERQADVKIAVVDGVWKIAGMNIFTED